MYHFVRLLLLKLKRSFSGSTPFLLAAVLCAATFALLFASSSRSNGTENLYETVGVVLPEKTIQRYSPSSKQTKQQQERPYEICFVTCIYSSSKEEADQPADVSAWQQANPDFRYFLYTNLDDIPAPGWTKITKNFKYRRYITQSRWGKFMSWKDPEIQGCKTVFYHDGLYEQKPFPAQVFRAEAAAIRQSKFGLSQHPHQHSFMDEFAMILQLRKDTQENVDKAINWFQAQPDFDSKCKLYINTFFGFDPTNPYYQQASELLWSYYSQEMNSWRDQPLWCYTLDRLHVNPISPGQVLFEPNWSHMGHNNHHYTATADNNAANSNVTSSTNK